MQPVNRLTIVSELIDRQTSILADQHTDNLKISKYSLVSNFNFSYELQIDEKYQNKGLGEHLMKCLEKLAKLWQMERVVLTVLTNNDGALRFYKRLGYTVDETSPDDEPSYQIFSKEV